jgi:hypothetical protein
MVSGGIADEKAGVSGFYDDAVKGGCTAHCKVPVPTVQALIMPLELVPKSKKLQAVGVVDGLNAIREGARDSGDVAAAAYHGHVGSQRGSQGDCPSDLAFPDAGYARVAAEETGKSIPSVGVGGVGLSLGRLKGN